MFKEFFKKVIRKAWGIVLGFLVFELVMLITTSKIYSINKNIIGPIYSNSDYSVKNLVMLIISMIMFVWLIKRKYVRNRKYIFGFSFGLTASFIFFTQTPFYQFYNQIGNNISAIIKSDAYYKNLVISSAKRYLGTDYADAIRFYNKLKIEELRTSEIPWVAMAHERDKSLESQEKARTLWNELYRRLDSEYGSKKDKVYKELYIEAFKSYSQKFFYTDFKTKEAKNAVETGLYEANKYMYGVGRKENQDEYLKIIKTLEDLGFEFIKDIKEYNSPVQTKLDDFIFH